MDSKRRFDGRAEDYARWRPAYPDEAWAEVLSGLGDPGDLRAADIGAGTGISSRALAERGVTVVAVEPGSDMRRVGVSVAAPLVRWSAASAERTGLAAGAFDLVLAAQAFHWFDREPALDEFVRILRPGGRVAVVWNCRDETDPATVAVNRVLDRHATHGRRRTTKTRPLDGRSDLRDVRLRTWTHGHPVGLEGLLGGARSSSYSPTTGPSLEVFLRDLRDVHARFADENGTLRIVFETEVWLAEVA